MSVGFVYGGGGGGGAIAFRFTTFTHTHARAHDLQPSLCLATAVYTYILAVVRSVISHRVLVVCSASLRAYIYNIHNLDLRSPTDRPTSSAYAVILRINFFFFPRNLCPSAFDRAVPIPVFAIRRHKSPRLKTHKHTSRDGMHCVTYIILL